MVAVLEALALHRLIIDPPPARVDPIGAADVGAMNPVAVRSLMSNFQEIIKRQESLGQAQSAWWVSTPPEPPDEIKRLMMANLREFDQASKQAMDRLCLAAPGAARGGLVLFLRQRSDGDATTLLCLKMELQERKLTRFKEAVSAAQAITVDDITNILPEPSELKKAALIPHPLGTADLRVVDEQLPDPAGYWLDFLGARARPKEPDIVRATAVATWKALQPLVGDAKASEALGQELQAVAAAPEPQGPRAFVDRVAERVEIPKEDLWQRVVQAEGKVALPDAVMTSLASERLDTIIELSDGVRVRGPATALEGRWRKRQRGDGWVLEIDSADEPVLRRVLR